MIDCLSFVITSRCNSKCIMCNCWKNQNDDLDYEYFFKNVFDDPYIREHVEVVEIFGGEPTLRPDLLIFLKYAVSNLKRLKKFLIITNGFLTNRLEAICTGILKFINNKKLNIEVEIEVSLDGLGKTHDKVRQVPGAFGKVLKTAIMLRDLKQRDSNFKYFYHCTMNNYNIGEIDQMVDFFELIRARGTFAALSTQDISVAANLNELLEKGIIPPKEEQLKIMKKLRKQTRDRNDSVDDYYNLDLQVKCFELNERVSECSFFNNTLFFDWNGKCYICPISNKGYIGDIKNRSVSELLPLVDQAKESLRQYCKKCTTECHSQTSLTANKIKDENITKVLYGDYGSNLKLFESKDTKNVIAVVNTDSSKNSSTNTIMKTKTISNWELIEMVFDALIVTDKKRRFQLKDELLKMGVPERKIYLQ